MQAKVYLTSAFFPVKIHPIGGNPYAARFYSNFIAPNITLHFECFKNHSSKHHLRLPPQANEQYHLNDFISNFEDQNSSLYLYLKI